MDRRSQLGRFAQSAGEDRYVVREMPPWIKDKNVAPAHDPRLRSLHSQFRRPAEDDEKSEPEGKAFSTVPDKKYKNVPWRPFATQQPGGNAPHGNLPNSGPTRNEEVDSARTVVTLDDLKRLQRRRIQRPSSNLPNTGSARNEESNYTRSTFTMEDLKRVAALRRDEFRSESPVTIKARGQGRNDPVGGAPTRKVEKPQQAKERFTERRAEHSREDQPGHKVSSRQNETDEMDSLRIVQSSGGSSQAKFRSLSEKTKYASHTDQVQPGKSQRTDMPSEPDGDWDMIDREEAEDAMWVISTPGMATHKEIRIMASGLQ